MARLAGHERVDDLGHAGGDRALRLLGRGADVVGGDDVGVPGRAASPTSPCRSPARRRTRRAPPVRRPASSASSRASSSTTSPREVLSRIAPGFICARNAASTRCRVSAFDGHVEASRCRTTTTARSSESHIVMPSSSARVSTYADRPGLASDWTSDAERGRALRDREADRAEADDAHGRAEQPARPCCSASCPSDRRAGRPRCPRSAGRSPAGAPSSARPRRPRCGRARWTTKTPLAGGGVGVDRVGARSGADHQRQPVRGLEHRALDLGAAHHQRVEPGDPGREVVGRQSSGSITQTWPRASRSAIVCSGSLSANSRCIARPPGRPGPPWAGESPVTLTAGRAVAP